jgi:hypothetical protein
MQKLWKNQSGRGEKAEWDGRVMTAQEAQWHTASEQRLAGCSFLLSTLCSRRWFGTHFSHDFFFFWLKMDLPIYSTNIC